MSADTTNYDESEVLTDYVCTQCTTHMNHFELEGLRVLNARAKAANTDSPAVRNLILKHWVGKADPLLLAALDRGTDAFRHAVRDRVLRDHPQIVNRCPKCNRVARTPRAKQCRWCLHDWH